VLVGSILKVTRLKFWIKIIHKMFDSLLPLPVAPWLSMTRVVGKDEGAETRKSCPYDTKFDHVYCHHRLRREASCLLRYDRRNYFRSIAIFDGIGIDISNDADVGVEEITSLFTRRPSNCRRRLTPTEEGGDGAFTLSNEIAIYWMNFFFGKKYERLSFCFQK